MPQPARRPSAILATLLLTAAGLTGCIGDDGSADDPFGPTSSDAGVFSATDVFPGEYDTEQARTLAPGPFAILSQETTLIPSELDGVDIMVFVARPDVPEGTKVPVVAYATPYVAPTYAFEITEDDGFIHDVITHGYAWSFISVRGSGDSGGCSDLMGAAERHDIDQAITWLGTRDWSNGNVGMFGGSYDGSTQWEAASTGNPHLKTIVPIAAIPSLFDHQIHNGTVAFWTPLQFAGLYWLLYGPVLYNPTTGRSPEHTAEQVACPGGAEALAVSMHTAATSEHDPLGYWESRDWRDEVLADYHGTVLLIQGFEDVTVEPHNAYPFVSRLEANGVVVKHVVGPWGHEAPWRADWAEIVLHWYDRWLKEDNAVDIGPRAQVMDNAGAWRSEPAWPPTDAVATAFYLTADGTLAAEPSSQTDEVPVGMSVPVHDPAAFAERGNAFWKVWEDEESLVCPACVSLTTGPLETELRFAGAPRLHVTVTPTGPGGHVTGILYAVASDGTAQRVGYGQMDLRFAAGDGTSSPVVPGTPIVARLQLQPTDAVVPAGSELVLLLHQGSYGVRMPSLPAYPVLVHVGGEASVLTLDTIVRGPEAFHAAPPRIGEGPAV